MRDTIKSGIVIRMENEIRCLQGYLDKLEDSIIETKTNLANLKNKMTNSEKELDGRIDRLLEALGKLGITISDEVADTGYYRLEFRGFLDKTPVRINIWTTARGIKTHVMDFDWRRIADISVFTNVTVHDYRLDNAVKPK